MPEIIWLGPMGSDEKSQRASELRDLILKDCCEHLGCRLYAPDTTEACDWLDQLLDRITSARGVVCDVSDERPNVYFELGFALALRLPTFLICQPGTHIHTDLANRQWHTYVGLEDIRPKLEEWLENLTERSNDLLFNTALKLPHHFRILEGDGDYEYVYDEHPERKSFILKKTAPELTIETITRSNGEIGELLHEVHEIQAELAAQTARPFHPGQLFGYCQHTPIREESGLHHDATIGYRLTDYPTFVATHYAVEALDDAAAIGLLASTKASSLSERVKAHMRTDEWPYARPLTATLFLVVNLGFEKRLIFKTVTSV